MRKQKKIFVVDDNLALKNSHLVLNFFVQMKKILLESTKVLAFHHHRHSRCHENNDDCYYCYYFEIRF